MRLPSIPRLLAFAMVAILVLRPNTPAAAQRIEIEQAQRTTVQWLGPTTLWATYPTAEGQHYAFIDAKAGSWLH